MRVPKDPKLERYTLKKIGAQILEQLNLERGLGYTVKMWIIDPRRALEEYLFENRQRMTKPFPFLLLLVAIATFVSLRVLVPEAELEQELSNVEELEGIPPFLVSGIALFNRYFSQYSGMIRSETQFGIIPNLSYRVEF